MSTERQFQSPKWYLQNFDLLETKLNGLSKSRFHELRREAFQKLKENGLPTPKQEEWKYTSLRDVENGEYRLAEPSSVETLSDEVVSSHRIPDLQCPEVVLVDGVYSEKHSSLPEGLNVRAFRGLSPDEAEALLGEAGAFGEAVGMQDDAVAALNGAYIQDFIILEAEKNFRSEEPVLIHQILSAGKNPKAIFPRVLMKASEGAEMKVIEYFYSEDPSERGFTSSITEAIVAEQARVEHYQLGFDGADVQRVSRIGIEQQRDSYFSSFSAAFGGALIRNEVHPTLHGENAETHMNGLSVLSGSQHVDNHTVLDHAVPHCESDELYKGIYDDRSKGVFCGTIIVRPDAQKTNAIQNNQGLLLSDRATLNTKPQLKIWADDVRCTHGATVGQLDQDALFYLRSRGLSKKDASRMLISAFAGEVTQRITVPALRAFIESELDRKLSR